MEREPKQSGIEFTPLQHKEINEFKRTVDCPYDFECCRLAPYKSQKANTIGNDQFIECDGCLTGENKPTCTFKMSFGMGYLCRCPVRKYFAVTMGV